MQAIHRFASILGLVVASIPAHAGSGPVAHWRFDEGKGTELVDSAAGASSGIVHGDARWIKNGDGHALQFDGVDDYVDCGNASRLDIRGPMTLELWLHPDAPPQGEPGIAGKFYESFVLTYYKTGSCYFYIGDGANQTSGPVRIGEWTHLAGVFDGTTLRFYINGVETHSAPSKFPSTPAGRNFMIGAKFGDPDHIDDALRDTEFFTGAIDEVRVYDRALSPAEIIQSYNENAETSGRKPIDVSRFDQLALNTFIYTDKGEAIAEADYSWLQSLPKQAKIRVDLLPAAGGKPLQSATLDANTPDRKVEAIFALTGVADGQYTLRAAVVDASGMELQTAERPFSLPSASVAVPSPADKTVGPLPAAYVVPKYDVTVAPLGGLNVTVNGVTYAVESSFSYPNGGDNLLVVKKRGDVTSEPRWSPHVRRIDEQTYQVHAAGGHYTIERTIKLTPTRVEVCDTITNNTDDLLGVIFSNQINTRNIDGAKQTIPPNPTVFAAKGDSGLGLIALDDLYQLQLRTLYTGGLAEMRDEHFGLEKQASYTIFWAIYPTGSGNYFDFVNQVRKDEGLNGHVAGGLELTSRWGPPPADVVKNKGLKYASVAYQTNAMDDPHVSIEGWEFMDYPKMQERLRDAIGSTRKQYPDMHAMFHVAHSLFATNTPKEKFPDSYALDEHGNLIHYGPNTLAYYGNYFPKELVDAGWRWFLFFPMLENSFGKYTLSATDFMIHSLGANAVWADGFITAYIPGEYLYDRFDGHSVTIDPKTRTATGKKAHVTRVSLPVLREIVKRFDEAGGVVITNDIAPPRSMWKDRMITSCETGGGDQQPVGSLYFAQTVTPLGNPTVIKTARDVYTDILAKLDLGALYFWYGEQNFVTEPTLVSHMYPITFDTIQPGTVRGLERIITKNPGIYGWPNDRSLHAVHTTDARGRLVPNTFVTTIDAGGVRTDLPLAEKQAAAIVRIPMEITSAENAPVNAILRQYDGQGIEIMLNASNSVTLKIRDGDFHISPDSDYVVMFNDQPIEITWEQGSGVIKVNPNGPATLKVHPQ